MPWARLREVEVHHVDLGAGYTPADWSDAFALRLLREIVAGTAGDAPAMVLRPFGLEHPLTVGDGTDARRPSAARPGPSPPGWPAAADGADLTVSPDGELPTPPRWNDDHGLHRRRDARRRRRTSASCAA